MKTPRVVRIGNADVRNILGFTLDELEVDKETKIPHHVHASFEFDIDKRQHDGDIERMVSQHLTDILGKPPRIFTVRGIPSEDNIFGSPTRKVQVDCTVNPFEAIGKGESHEKA